MISFLIHEFALRSLNGLLTFNLEYVIIHLVKHCFTPWNHEWLAY